MGKKSKSKLTKHNLLRASSALGSALPRTARFSKQSLHAFLDQYKKVIVKPATGSGGAGVMLITRKAKGRYRVQRGPAHYTLRGKLETYRYLRRKITTSYLIQRGISLARVNGALFDVRVMVQKRSGSPWAVTGILAKVAGRGYIITNVKRSKGRVLPIRSAIQRSSIRGASTSTIIARLRRIAILAAKRLARYYTSQKVFGLDMGIDASGRVWIIEANLHPDITLFLKLADKSMYNRICAYRRHV
ncbi:YheC/YheD family protein [Brevibacillus sp. AF8]|uniref:YheC/YheD family protein n=1 Tax=Brevibacillus sp. AF8 TaxID=2825881 RepID=UPI001E53DEDC|nr:YheC/YheD family protein [Brevibacillus sp. AF8]MCE0451024.1 YheC/YheD family protein [Brevibacillus sp. AF8]